MKKSSNTPVTKNDVVDDTSVVCRSIDILEDVRACTKDEELHVVANGGDMRYRLVGRLKVFPVDAYYNKRCIANIVSLKKLSQVKGIRIWMDSRMGNSIDVCLDDKTYVFKEGADGLYSYDMRKEPIKGSGSNNNNNDAVAVYPSFSLINTGHTIKNKYTQLEIRKADKARELQSTLGHISDSTLIKYLNNNLIKNCDLEEKDVMRATEIYGESEPILKGKMIAP